MQLQAVLHNNILFMKFLVILLLVALFFSTMQVSYSQLVPPQQVEDLPKALVQIILRNSEGQLVAYIEGTKILRINPSLLNQYLDTLPNKETIIIEGKNYELFQWEQGTENIDKTHSMALYVLKVLPTNGQYRSALSINHNAYQVEAGDTIEIFYTIMMPVS